MVDGQCLVKGVLNFKCAYFENTNEWMFEKVVTSQVS